MKLIAHLSLVMLLLLLASCGGVQGKQEKHAAFVCATVDIGKTIPEIGLSVFQRVMAVINAGADGWKDELIKIGVHDGEDVLACAAKAAYAALTANPIGAQPAPATPAALRARAFIRERSYEYQ